MDSTNKLTMLAINYMYMAISNCVCACLWSAFIL